MVDQTAMPEDIPLEIKSVHIDLQEENNLLTEMETVGYGFEFTIKVKTYLSVKEGKPDVQIDDISFGLIPVPGMVKEKIAAFMAQKVDSLMLELTETEIGGKKIDLEFKDIKIQQEEMTVTVLIKPED